MVVVGGGYAGVELASVLAERLRGRAGYGAGLGAVAGGGGCRVTLVTPGSDVLEGSPAGQREAARRVLEQLGVDIMAGERRGGRGKVRCGEFGD